jgi:hypothetical protein
MNTEISLGVKVVVLFFCLLSVFLLAAHEKVFEWLRYFGKSFFGSISKPVFSGSRRAKRDLGRVTAERQRT